MALASADWVVPVRSRKLFMQFMAPMYAQKRYLVKRHSDGAFAHNAVVASMGDKNEVWPRIQWAIHHAGLTDKARPEDVAPTEIARLLTKHRLKIGQPSVSKWKAGGLPDFKHVLKLAYLTGASVEWLWTGRGAKTVQELSGFFLNGLVRDMCRGAMQLDEADQIWILQWVVNKLALRTSPSTHRELRATLDSLIPSSTRKVVS